MFFCLETKIGVPRTEDIGYLEVVEVRTSV